MRDMSDTTQTESDQHHRLCLLQRSWLQTTFSPTQMALLAHDCKGHHGCSHHLAKRCHWLGLVPAVPNQVAHSAHTRPQNGIQPGVMAGPAHCSAELLLLWLSIRRQGNFRRPGLPAKMPQMDSAWTAGSDPGKNTLLITLVSCVSAGSKTGAQTGHRTLSRQ